MDMDIANADQFHFPFIYILIKKNQGVFVKHNAPGGNKVQKAILKIPGKLDLGVIWKGVISGVRLPGMKSLSLKVQKL